MNEIRLDSTTALSRAHAALLEDLAKLEAAAASATLDARVLFDRLDLTAKCLTEHFRLEEQNGYMETVRTRSPHLGREIDRLKEEHRQLLDSVKQLHERARDSQRVDDAFRKQLGDLIEGVRNHETRENLLIEDAFNRDTPAED
jgi:uncharacterized protein YlxW (UPF0749 family)